jgi:NADH-quinone oxidoreductase subunit N
MGATIPSLPLIILVGRDDPSLILEPFTARREESDGQIAIYSPLLAFLATYTLRIRYQGRTILAFGGMFVLGDFTLFFQWLFLVITAIAALISMRFNERESINRGEYYALLLFACSGMLLMAGSGDLILTFLGIEILSIATYVLAGFKRDDVRSNESSLKYFLLGSFATAFLLYGIALIYGGAGSTNYHSIRAWSRSSAQDSAQVTTLIGMGLLLVVLGSRWPRFRSMPGLPTYTKGPRLR